MLIFGSCQKENNEVEKFNLPYSTSIRTTCAEAVNIITNGDFSDYCANGVLPFQNPTCIGGEWFGYSSNPKINNGEAISENVCLGRNLNNITICIAPSFYYDVSLSSGIDYCLDFDAKFTESVVPINQANIEDWEICVYASNILPSNVDLMSPHIPSTYTDPTVLNQSEKIFCYALTNSMNNNWESYPTDFNLANSANQLWPVVQPRDGIDINAGLEFRNHGNEVRWDNFSLKCVSDELIEISGNPDDCVVHFIANVSNPLNIIDYIWDFGDESEILQEITVPYPTHLYENPGKYNVSLTIIDINGCTSTMEIEVEVDSCSPMDYCKYICHEEYLMPGFTCAVGILYNDHNPNTSVSQPLPFSQPYEHTDFVGIANEIETRLNNLGFNMLVSNYDPYGEITCYKSICIGCDGSGTIPSQFEIDLNGDPTGLVLSPYNFSGITGNGILVGQTGPDPVTGLIVDGTGFAYWGTITVNDQNPNTVVVTPNQGGGWIIQYEETEGIFAMGDVEILRIIGNNEFDGTSCDNADLNNTPVSTIFFHHCP